MSGFSFVAALLSLAAIFGFINNRFLRLPASTGVLLIALIVSILLLAVDPLVTGHPLGETARHVLGTMDLPGALMNGALAFLLFAGALHVDIQELWSRKWTVGLLATTGVLLAVSILGGTMWLVFRVVGHPLPFIWCLVLGSILAPTDPVSVVGLLKRLGLPTGLRTIFAGESLFNDGVGVVVFGALLGIATGGAGMISGAAIATTFLTEAVGGSLLGLVTGWVALWMMRRLDDVDLELLISLALATGTYSLAQALHLSGPIAVVVAGLAMGSNRGRNAMSEATHRHVMTFWSLIDELLNTLLFLLIGVEIVAVPLGWSALGAAALAIPLALAARAVSIFVPSQIFRLKETASFGPMALLTWGGLRGGISVALALNLPEGEVKSVLLPVCYAVVIFSVVVQGLTMPAVVRRVLPNLGS
jgi:monovalent cation:H+ antiporter, CPA1 family